VHNFEKTHYILGCDQNDHGIAACNLSDPGAVDWESGCGNDGLARSCYRYRYFDLSYRISSFLVCNLVARLAAKVIVYDSYPYVAVLVTHSDYLVHELIESGVGCDGGMVVSFASCLTEPEHIAVLESGEGVLGGCLAYTLDQSSHDAMMRRISAS